ncbi:PilW family protein [Undibacterium sp. TJN19]|uniref:PilW family protein n=1 Tax=Undibacterium sp. TJN19 TaxID=3413055 RepID=UPI003BEF5245
MKNNFFSKHYQQGLTIIELMIALTLGLVISMVAASIFAFSSKGFSVQQEQTSIQEAGRTALGILGRTVRTTSDFGCRSDWTVVKSKSFVNKVNPAASYAYTFGTDPLSAQLVGYTGITSDWSPTIPTDLPIPSNADKTSDIITVRGATGDPATVVAPFMTTVTDAVTVNTQNGFAAGDVLAISDCSSTTIFQVSGTPDASGTLAHTTSGTPGNVDTALFKNYPSGADVYKLVTTTFYVAPSQFNTGPSLWRIVGTNAPEELVQNVERLKIVYGMDPTVGVDNTKRDYSPNYYLAANDTGIDMTKVVSVRINVLVRSPSDNVSTINQTYIFNSASVTATDKRLRNSFTTTINLRNRVL